LTEELDSVQQIHFKMEEKVKEIVRQKGGQIFNTTIKGAFSTLSLRCFDNHFFELYANDILLNDEWCPKCKKQFKTITQCLRSLNVEYKVNEDNIIIDDNNRKFIFSTRKVDIKGYINVIYDKDFCENYSSLKYTLWEGLKNNKIFSLTKKSDLSKYFKLIELIEINENNYIKIFDKYNRNICYVTTIDDEVKITKFTSKNNIEVSAIYFGEEAFKKISPNYNTLIVVDVNCITTSVFELLKILENNNIIDLNFNYSLNKDLLEIIISLGIFELTQISKISKFIKARKRNVITKPPYGYKIGDEPIIVKNEQEQEVIEKIRAIVAKKKITAYKLTQILNSMKDIPAPRKSKQWYHTFVRNLCKREGIKLKS